MHERVQEFADNENARLRVLRNLRLLDTPPSESYDRITRLASKLLAAPVSTITLTDRDRLWFKSRVGIVATEAPRERSPCNYTTMRKSMFVVPDLLEDARFRDGVLAQAGVRLYAGAPLVSADGFGLGTICVLDEKPRDLTDEDRQVLRDLARLVMGQIEQEPGIGCTDPTSGFPNEQALLDRLESLALTAPGAPAWGLMVDLATSRPSADEQSGLGDGYAEALLKGALSAVERGFGDGSSLFSVGQTRFAMLPAPQTSIDLRDAVARVRTILNAPILCCGVPISPSIAIGTHAFEHGRAAHRDVLRRLLAAVEDAGISGTRMAEYRPHENCRSARTFRLVADFQSALQSPEQLALAFQPRISLIDMRCHSAEALLRWRHPSMGAIRPDEYIPHVERSALGARLTDWVVADALRQARLFRLAGRDITISINASAHNLEEHDFADRLIDAITRAGVRPRQFELEFTENAFARDSARVIDQLAELRGFGVQIAIDDFGAGYANLSYLQQLPASVLKIDRQLIKRLEASHRDQKLVQTVIRMAHELGYRVVAEGVETHAALDLLRSWNCDEGQGYLLAHPLPAADLERWLDADSA